MNELEQQEVIKRRLAYRIGDSLPKPIRIVYYTLLIITLIYSIYRLIAGTLWLIQTIGSFIFEKRNFYTFVVCILILAVGILLASQFIFNLQPFEKFCNFFVEKWNDLRCWVVELVGG